MKKLLAIMIIGLTSGFPLASVTTFLCLLVFAQNAAGTSDTDRLDEALRAAEDTISGELPTRYLISKAIKADSAENVWVLGVLSDNLKKNPNYSLNEIRTLLQNFPKEFSDRRKILRESQTDFDWANFSKDALNVVSSRGATLPDMIPHIREGFHRFMANQSPVDPAFATWADFMENNLGEMKKAALTPDLRQKIGALITALEKPENLEQEKAVNIWALEKFGQPLTATINNYTTADDSLKQRVVTIDLLATYIREWRKAQKEHLPPEQLAKMISEDLSKDVGPTIAKQLKTFLKPFGEKRFEDEVPAYLKLEVALSIADAVRPLVTSPEAGKNLRAGIALGKSLVEFSKAGQMLASPAASASMTWTAAGTATGGLALFVGAISMMQQDANANAMSAIFDFLQDFRKEMNKRFDEIEKTLAVMDIKLDAIRSDLNAGFESVNTNLKALSMQNHTEFQGLLARLDDVAERIQRQEYLISSGFSDLFWLNFQSVRRKSQYFRYSTVAPGLTKWMKTADELATLANNVVSVEAVTSNDTERNAVEFCDPFTNINSVIAGAANMVGSSSSFPGEYPNPVAWSKVAMAYAEHLENAPDSFRSERLPTDSIALGIEGEKLLKALQAVKDALASHPKIFETSFLAADEAIQKEFVNVSLQQLEILTDFRDDLNGSKGIRDLQQLTSVFDKRPTFTGFDVTSPEAKVVIPKLAADMLSNNRTLRQWLRGYHRDAVQGEKRLFVLELDEPTWDLQNQREDLRAYVKFGDHLLLGPGSGKYRVPVVYGYASLKFRYRVKFVGVKDEAQPVASGAIYTNRQHMFYGHIASSKDKLLEFTDPVEGLWRQAYDGKGDFSSPEKPHHNVNSTAEAFFPTIGNFQYKAQAAVPPYAILFGSVGSTDPQMTQHARWRISVPVEKFVKNQVKTLGKELIAFDSATEWNSDFQTLMAKQLRALATDRQKVLEQKLWDQNCAGDPSPRFIVDKREINLTNYQDAVRVLDERVALLLHVLQIFAADRLSEKFETAEVFGKLRRQLCSKNRRSILCLSDKEQAFGLESMPSSSYSEQELEALRTFFTVDGSNITLPRIQAVSEQLPKLQQLESVLASQRARTSPLTEKIDNVLKSLAASARPLSKR